MRIGPFALATLFALACAHQPPHRQTTQPQTNTRRYTVLMSTNKAGTQVVTTRGNEITVDYEFNDRGRGPKTRSVIRLDERSVPVAMSISGNDYFKQNIAESFTSLDGKATWTNTAETGDALSNAFYVSMYGPPEEAAVLARALLRNGGRMPLLPGGEASIRKAGEMTIRDMRVTAYEISGLGFTPFELWLDDDLELFASVSAWSSTIREGFEADARQLLEAQDARATSRIAEVSRKVRGRSGGGSSGFLGVPRSSSADGQREPEEPRGTEERRGTNEPSNRLTITNTRIFDPRSGSVSEQTSIHIEGNRIARIGGEPRESEAEVINAAGKMILPGLWDMHTHLSETDGILNLAAGVTSVRDLGNDSDTIIALKRHIDEGRWIGPRVSLAGLVDGRGPFQGPTNILADNEDEARKAVDFFAARNYEGLKIYSSIKPELVPFLTRYAHERGLRVSGHIPAGMRAADAIDAGYDEIQHANMLFLNFMPDVTDTRTPARFTEVGKRGADLDLKSDEVRAFIAKLRERKVVVDPTLAIFEGMFTARAGTIAPGYAMVAHRFPPQVRRAFLAGGLPVPEGMDAQYRASFRRMLDLVAELHRSGVIIVAGTDALPGFALHRELELYAEAGIPNIDVLRIATLVPAEILKRHDLGTIEAGKLADLIIVDGDPTARMSDIRRIVTVVKDGLVFDPAALYAEVGVLP